MSPWHLPSSLDLQGHLSEVKAIKWHQRKSAVYHPGLSAPFGQWSNPFSVGPSSVAEFEELSGGEGECRETLCSFANQVLGFSKLQFAFEKKQLNKAMLSVF